MCMTRLILKLLTVFIGQAVMGWLFYRSRVVTHSRWAESDFIVFGAPLMVGFFVASLVVFFSGSQRGPAMFGLAACGAAASSLVGSVIGFNLYGT
jgi:hypothetical protein